MGETVMQNEIDELREKFRVWETGTAKDMPDLSGELQAVVGRLNSLDSRVKSLEVKLGNMRKLVSNYLDGSVKNG